MIPFHTENLLTRHGKHVVVEYFSMTSRRHDISSFFIIKDVVEIAVNRLEFDELKISCVFDNEWKIILAFARNASDIEQTFFEFQPFKPTPTQNYYCTEIANRLVEEFRSSQGQERQLWKITSRRINRLSYRHEVEITHQSQRLFFGATSFRIHNESVDVATYGSCFVEQVVINNWVEIEANFDCLSCNHIHGCVNIDNLELNAFVLDYHEYNQIINFIIQPNIVPKTFRGRGDTTIFEAYSVPESARIHRPRVTVGDEYTFMFSDSNRGRVWQEIRRSIAREVDNIDSFTTSTISNKTCKYFNESAYLKCAVNPSGACEGCKDYEPSG